MLGGQGQVPILVLKEGTTREHGKDAKRNNINAAKAIADAVRSTLGPRGMDKMLVDSMGDVVISNDGVTILKEIDVEHPAAKMIIEAAKTQDEECRDGTTTAVVLAGEFLKRSEELIEQNVHPTIITGGFRMAMDHAVSFLNKLADPVKPTDDKTLREIAITAMTGKSAEAIKDHLADISVKAVKSIMEKEGNQIRIDLDNIKIEKKHGGAIQDTELIEGIIIDKERVHSGMPKTIKNAKIALLNAALEVKKTEVDAKIQITSPTQLQDFLNEEEKMLKGMVDKIVKAGANVVICQKGIDDLPQHYLSKAGIYAIRRAKKSDMEKIAKATNARIVTNIHDLTIKDLGKAGMVEEKKIANDEMTYITGCKEAKAISILVRGGTDHVVDEIERNLNDSLGVVAVALEDGKVLIGGGATPMELSQNLREFATTVGGREQLAIEAFATAIEIIPRTLAENAGLDPINTFIDLRKAHKSGKRYMGLNVWEGSVTDMKKLKIIEPMRVMKQAIQGATETAIMILRIDDVIASRSTGGAPGGMPGGGMPPGMGGMGGMGDMD
ncbi:MAG: thermosome subunit beta [Candidatus Thorarchaeota archaeon]